MKALQSHLLDEDDTILASSKLFILEIDNINQTMNKYEVFHIIEDIADAIPLTVNKYAELCVRLADKLEFFGFIFKEQFEVHVIRNLLLYHIPFQHFHFYKVLLDIGFMKKRKF